MKQALNNLITIFKIIIGLPIYWLSKLFPKDKKLSVIGSSLGRHFADNSKYFFIKHYDSEIARQEKNLVWISKDSEVVSRLNELGLPAKNLYSLSGIYTVLRASKAYLSHQLSDINGALLGGAKIIQLWHAMALRKIGYGGDWTDNNFSGKVKVFISKWFPYSYYMKCDVLYAPCQIAKENSIEAFSKSFRNNKVQENIVLARQARTICFDEGFELSTSFFPEIKELKFLDNKYDKIIAWLPTHRTIFNKSILDIISDSKLDLIQLSNYCKSKNVLFVIKAHFLDFDLISQIVKNLDNLYVYPHPDPYPLLKFTDILVTDYSSVFFDFLMLDKPIVFMAHDFEEYSNKLGFYFDYKQLDLGPICYSWPDTLKIIAKIIEENDDYGKKRKQQLSKFNFVKNLTNNN
ncbi:CDP-glycerol glycerophosphotransferase family protein [Winogradskyella ursingii]|uniref:CDP-glycerol glycerophosphotransferase family protein n=1 Tax=Winogradskyella ursingii TaxID=2686079 RepID=UPI0015CED340|nr:CDP-glycerol glycerophosphotransferase family protein [Winogradskyella ursingii]